MPLLINGRFLSRPVTGVERYGHMLLDVISAEWPTARILVPGRWQGPDSVRGLEVERIGGLGGHAWEQVQLPRAVGAHDILLSPANTGPLRVRNQALVIHDLAALHHPEWFDRRLAAWYGFLLPRLVRRAARVLTVSAYSAADIRRSFSLSEDRVCVVPPFVQWRGPADHRSPISGAYVLMVASHDPRKGLDQAIAWYKGLHDPAFKLIIVGRGLSSFRNAAFAPVSGVEFREAVSDDELRSLYVNAISLVHLSCFEGFGLPILEALQLGLPVIAFELPVIRESFGDAVSYLPLNDTSPLKDLVHGLMREEARSQRIMHGQACARQYTRERMALALRSVIDLMLNS